MTGYGSPERAYEMETYDEDIEINEEAEENDEEEIV